MGGKTVKAFIETHFGIIEGLTAHTSTRTHQKREEKIMSTITVLTGTVHDA